MNNKISNTKTEVPCTVEMNDKDYLNETLACLKTMQKNYATALTESSNENLYKTYLKIFLKISDIQRKTYELMFQNGWYELEKVENKKLKEKFDMFSKEYNSLYE